LVGLVYSVLIFVSRELFLGLRLIIVPRLFFSVSSVITSPSWLEYKPINFLLFTSIFALECFLELLSAHILGRISSTCPRSPVSSNTMF
jgi:hypothetical protein